MRLCEAFTDADVTSVPIPSWVTELSSATLGVQAMTLVFALEFSIFML